MPDCTQVDIQEPVPDESEITPTVASLSSPSPETINLEVRLVNRATSGSGSSRTVTLNISLNGNLEVSESVSLQSGETTNRSYEFTGAPTGTVSVDVATDDGTDSGSVNVEEPVPDESEVTVLLEEATSPAPNELEATATAANEVVSGEGEWLGVQLLLTVNGEEVASEGYELRGGESRTANFSVTGIDAGPAEVCADFRIFNRG